MYSKKTSELFFTYFFVRVDGPHASMACRAQIATATANGRKGAMAHCPRPNAGLCPPLGPLKGTGTQLGHCSRAWGNGVFVFLFYFLFALPGL